MTAKIECRTPDQDHDRVVAIPAWKYDCVRSAILDAIVEAGDEGIPFSELPGIVARELTEEERENLGSLAWHTLTVKLNMEVDGEILRKPGPGPQVLILNEGP